MAIEAVGLVEAVELQLDQAGAKNPVTAVLAAMGLLLMLGDVRWSRNLSDLGKRILFATGLAIFLAVALGVITNQRGFLECPTPMAKMLILLVEAVATVSIAAILLALFSSGSLREADSKDGSERPAE